MFGARPVVNRTNRCVAETGSELQLVVHFTDVEELRTIKALQVRGPVKREVQIAAMPHVRGVAPRDGIVTDAAVRPQAPSKGDIRPQAGEVEAGAEDLRVFELVDFRRSELVPRCFERTRCPEVSRIANFVAFRIEGHGAVARKDLPV